MIYQMTWLTVVALVRGVLDCFHFVGNRRPNHYRAISAKSQRWQRQWQKKRRKKKDSAVLLIDSTSRSNLLALKSERIALFCFNNVTFCVPPLFSFSQRGEELWHILPRSLLMMWLLEIKVIVKTCVCFNLEFFFVSSLWLWPKHYEEMHEDEKDNPTAKKLQQQQQQQNV